MGIAADESQFHVLAVDDSLIDRTLIERLLKRSSYQVTTVDSGSKALEFLGLIEDDQSSSSDSPSVSTNTSQEVEVNLVITDYCMPGMTGYDLLKRIKESSALRDIPVVIMSSENVPSRINRCLEEGAEEFFLKPVRLSDVHRLKPHLMRNKSNDHHGLQSHQKMEGDADGDQEEESSRMLEVDAQSPSQQPQQMHQLQHQNSNKRKSMEEGISPNRTRLRLNDVAAVV